VVSAGPFIIDISNNFVLFIRLGSTQMQIDTELPNHTKKKKKKGRSPSAFNLINKVFS
jgi:hypothetical protein